MWWWMKPFPYLTPLPLQPWSPPLEDSRTEKRPVDRKAMSDSLVVCEVDPELKEKLRKFRFRKETDNAAIISECHLPPRKYWGGGTGKEDLASVTDGWVGHLTPACHPSPVKVDKDRQMVVLEEEFQYVHEDGRVSYPLCFIFSSPVGCKPEQQMMYAGSKNRLVQTAELTKVFEIRTTDDLTEAWLQEKLSFFR
ncbi:hypothetical protein MC885_003554 [Smutsia gigantea]|nr:hypothetical protein MC885_003554 [Smutsia gigantea]